MILFSSLFMVFRLDFVDILSCKRCNFKLLCEMKKKQIEGGGIAMCTLYTVLCALYIVQWHPDAYTLLSLHNYNIFVQMECIYVLY